MIKLFKSQGDIVQRIHDEFDSAQDRLLCEAQKIISMNAVDYVSKKAKRLEKAGFINVELVTVSKGKEKALVEGKEQADTIAYYKQKYPFQKFITQSELDRICEKYGLIYAPVAYYIKDVPDKNLADIENVASLDICDYAENEYWIDITGVYYGKSLPAGVEKRFRLPEQIKKSYLASSHSASQWSILNTFISRSSDNSEYTIRDHTLTTLNRDGLFIAAPKSNFKLDGLKQKGKYSFLNFTITEVKDPIVFRYVKGGIQIITKWGLEASDPAIVNEIEN